MKRLLATSWRRLALAAASLGLIAGAVYAATLISYSPMVELSTVSTLPGAIDGNNAIKGKIMGLQYEDPVGSGNYVDVLISVYSDSSVSAASTNTVWDFEGAEYVARDVFVTRSVDGGDTWSQPECVSIDKYTGETFANSTSAAADPDGLLGPIVSQDFYGDCEKPQIFGTPSTGRNAAISFHCAFDMEGQGAGQKIVEYPEFGGISRPYFTTYVIKTSDGGETWGAPQQLGDCSRDAKQVAIRGSGAGMGVIWQEDPNGLQPGEGDGPGDGGSGAKASQGTDVWYTALRASDFATLDWPAPARVTNNATQLKDGIENGPERATRPQVAIIGQTAVVAYEEVKGLEKFDSGKYIRYHTFPAFNYPFTQAATHATSGIDYAMTGDVTMGQGWIISKPDENARRVRIIMQGQPGPTTGMLMAFVYKQGFYDGGGPSDIMFRVGSKDTGDASSTGMRPEDLYPGINFTSNQSYPLPIGLETGSDRELAFGNQPAINLSSIEGLNAESEDNNIEDARAHRGIMDGDRLAIGYIWTSNQALARYTDLDNFNFFIRRSFDGGHNWDASRNLSNISDTTISVREPRMVRCPTTPNPADPTNRDTYIVAFGTHVNEYEHLATRTLNRNIFITRTTDYGETYEPVQNFTDTGNIEDENQECQIRVSADGKHVNVVWMQENHATGEFKMMYRQGVEVEVPDESKSSQDDDEGCTTGGGGGLPWMLLAALAALTVVGIRGVRTGR